MRFEKDTNCCFPVRTAIPNQAMHLIFSEMSFGMIKGFKDWS
jgi:hypothetical protein